MLEHLAILVGALASRVALQVALHLTLGARRAADRAIRLDEQLHLARAARLVLERANDAAIVAAREAVERLRQRRLLRRAFGSGFGLRRWARLGRRDRYDRRGRF
jgi:hypothetical protein